MSSSESGQPSEVSPQLLKGLKDEAERLYVDATYSGRAHLNSGSRWQKCNFFLGVPATVVSSFLAAGAAVSALIDGTPWITAALAGTAAILNGLKSFLQPEVKAQTHSVKGNQYLTIRSDARMFLVVDLRSGLPQEKLVSALKDLRRRYNELIQTDPQLIAAGSYKVAQRGVKAGEASYKDDPVLQELSEQ
jgi:hypothetical protein